MQRRPLGDIAINRYVSSSALTTSASTACSGSTVTLPQFNAARTTYSSFKAPVDPDAESLNVSEYARDVFEYLRKVEGKYKPSVTYMAQQNELTDRMRAILIDWIVDVHLKFKLHPETFFLTVQIVDRFLDQRKVSKSKLQLLGVVSMLLAAKYEEIYPPEIESFIYISASTYTRDEVLKWERMVLATMEYNLTVPTLYSFLRRGLQVMDADKSTSFMAQYFAELSTLDYKMLVYLPSTVAAACLYLANRFEGREGWSLALEQATQLRVANFDRCAAELLELVRNAPNTSLQAVPRKYSSSKCDAVHTRIKSESLADKVTL